MQRLILISRQLALAGFFVAVSLATPSNAQAQTPTAAQSAAFRNLPADQQQALMESLGGDGNGTSGTKTDRKLKFPETVRPREKEKGDTDIDDRFRSQENSIIPRLRPNDTILLSLPVRQATDSLEEVEEPNSLSDNRSTDIANKNDPNSRKVTAGAITTAAKKKITRADVEKKRLEDIQKRVERRNPYQLDKYGILDIPELGPVPLAGLSVDEAMQRLSADPNFSQFAVRIVLLPLKPIGISALKPFGYDLFSGSPSTFAPATDVPVPSDYVVGPGDTIEVQLIGNTKGKYSLVVGRDGQIKFPELGPVAVGGLHFQELRSLLEKRVRDQMIGTQINIGMGELRSIRVFVLGDAEQPGSYTVSGLSTITNALFVSGGVKPIGSLRNIQLKRDGVVITNLDLYNLLLNGDTRADVRLMPGDVIFIPPIGPTASVAGEVRRPAIYELKGDTTAADLLKLSGGLSSQADSKLATLQRIDNDRQKITLDTDLTSINGNSVQLMGGDILSVPPIRPSLEDSVTVSGYVYRPGDYQYKTGMRLTSVLSSVAELKPNADQGYILIRREMPNKKTEVFSADLSIALAARGSDADIELAPKDRIYVFDLESGRDRVIDPILRDLRLQSIYSEPTQRVRVGGQVKVPGQYPLEPKMRVSDLIRAGGSLSEAAYNGEAELTRYETVNGKQRETGLIKIDLSKALAGDRTADLFLKPFDYLIIKEIPKWSAQDSIEIKGEVRFPGVYPIQRGETLRSVIERAGGLTDLAFADGSVFLRKELKEREREQFQTLANRMQSSIAQLSLETAQETKGDAGQALAVGQSLLDGVRSAEPIGRLVINLNHAVHARPGSPDDVMLKDGDSLLIPTLTQEVTVIGEVQSPTSHFFEASLNRDQYIQMSGGMTRQADKKNTYVVRANGSVVVKSGNSWFSASGVDIHPGDTIVVPLNTAYIRPLPFWTAVTTILYNLAITTTAIHSFL